MAAEVMGGFLQVHPRVTQRSKRLANFGMRFRRGMINRSTDDHPLHLHRHTFEVTSLDGKQLSGLNKDVVIVPASTTAEADFTASNPGFDALSLPQSDAHGLRLYDAFQICLTRVDRPLRGERNDDFLPVNVLAGGFVILRFKNVLLLCIFNRRATGPVRLRGIKPLVGSFDNPFRRIVYLVLRHAL